MTNPLRCAHGAAARPEPIWHSGHEPDVWWGESGIDADIWSDPIPYVKPLMDASAEVAEPLRAGDPR